jgi:DNA polymerase-3 subunit gamma/tau
MLGIDYRPTRISNEQIVGQSTIVKALQNGLKHKTLPKSIAFIGKSGQGKSTLARCLALAIQCEHPITDEEGNIYPCEECSSCKDILKGNYNRGTTVINGNDLVQDKMRELENSLSYDSMYSNANVVIIEEAQLIPNQSSKTLLNLLEQDKAYIILTSTDSQKFCETTYKKDNASQEKNALRSRLTMMKLKDLTSDDISSYLFKVFTEKLDSEGKLSDEYLNIIPYIAYQNKGNLRGAVNDLFTVVNAEVTDKNEMNDLLGYTDEEKESELVTSLLFKDKTVLHYIKEHMKELDGNFPYWYTILSSLALRDMLGEPFEQEYKEKNYQRCKKSNNIQNLFRAFNETQQLCSNYFNVNVFISKIYEYYCGNNQNTKRLVENVSSDKNNESSLTKNTVVKKIKKIV